VPPGGHRLDVTSDPYPDLTGAEPDRAMGSGDAGAADGRPALSKADSRLLAALSQPQPPVVTAVEDQPRTARAARDDGVAPLSAPRGRSPLAPVFQEPTD
jgi:hypothetical protein